VRAALASTLAAAIVVFVAMRTQNHGPLPPKYALQAGWLRVSAVLFYVGPALTALSIAGATESRQYAQRFIDGESRLVQLVITMLLVSTVCLGTGLLLLSCFVATEAVECVASGPGVGAGADWAATAAMILKSATVSWIVILALGVVVGCYVESRGGALLGSLGIGIGTQLLLMATTSGYPGLGWTYVLTPQGGASVLTGLESAPSSVAGAASAAAAIGLGLFATAVALAERFTARRSLGIEKAGRPQSARRTMPGRGSRRPITLPLTAGGLVLTGLVMPVALRSEVPWYLRPAWLSDKAHHTTSLDTAHQFLDAMRTGDVAAADRLTDSGNAETTLGPYLPVVTTSGPPELSIRQRAMGDPGLVQVRWSTGVSFALCAHRGTAGWSISELRSDGQCPRAMS
jgi:hypothetical protein